MEGKVEDGSIASEGGRKVYESDQTRQGVLLTMTSMVCGV